MTAPIRDKIIELATSRGASGSLDPGEVARAYAADRATPKDPPDLWRRYLRPVREEAIGLAREGRVEILRKGKPVDPDKPVRGVIRIRIATGQAKA